MRRFVSQRTLQIGFAALMLIVLAMLGTQLWLLLQLKNSSTANNKLTMRDFLISVISKTDDFYRDAADGLLNLTPDMVMPPDAGPFQARLRQRWRGMAKAFFILNLAGPNGAKLTTYDSQLRPLLLADDSSELRAIHLASARWVMASQEPSARARARLVVDERDEQNRVVLQPILDAESKAVAVAGFIVDAEFFKESFLRSLLQQQLADFFPNGGADNIVVTVQDGSGAPLYGIKLEEGRGNEISRGWSFLFRDWRLTVESRYITPEQWAQRSFLLNLALAGMLAVVVLAAIFIAMKGAFRAVKLSEMKTEFVSNVSHELRTPLSSIKVLGEFLSEGRVKDSEQIRRYGAYIEAESQRLTHLIDNILDFAKIETGRMTYHFELADGRETVAEIIESADVPFLWQGFTIHYQPETEAPVRIRLDKDAVAEAVLNLIDNAAKYSGSARDIFVKARRVDGSFEIAVQDQGVGLRVEEHERIFEKFYRVDDGLVHNVKGTGLGLSIAKHVVEAHGGSISVVSQPGQGSTFTIHLPVCKEEVHAEGVDRRG